VAAATARPSRLRGLGFDAWGLDNAPLRRSQWSRLGSRAFLVVADGRSMPFATGSFDYVLCSGVLEHVGVTEFRHEGRYHVAPAADRDVHRATFWAELQRVVVGEFSGSTFRTGSSRSISGTGTTPGRLAGTGARAFSRHRAVRALLKGAAGVTALSPQGDSASSRWEPLVTASFVGAAALLRRCGCPRWLSETRLNPFLVCEIENR
jgi:hypothetical protein